MRRFRMRPASRFRPLIGAAAIAAAAVVLPGCKAEPARQGAVILVSIDTLRADRLPV
jgi:hypothetical protein